MQLFICINGCGQSFSEDNARYIGGPDEPTHMICPFCGESDLADAEACAACGEEQAVEDMTEDYCWDCFDYLMDAGEFD